MKKIKLVFCVPVVLVVSRSILLLTQIVQIHDFVQKPKGIFSERHFGCCSFFVRRLRLALAGDGGGVAEMGPFNKYLQ